MLVSISNGSFKPKLDALVILFVILVFLPGALKPISPLPPAALRPFLKSISTFASFVAPLLSPANERLPLLKEPVFFPPVASFILVALLPLTVC